MAKKVPRETFFPHVVNIFSSIKVHIQVAGTQIRGGGGVGGGGGWWFEPRAELAKPS